ncbi:hypothetical protein Baya_5111 [Bagarius yarrelli]|uniref:RPA-related protein RADX n=1 Tax=Bagarius yarrelli TaxID=175774 RepID=A0A556TVE8_BAGYA|nr:hypothetical protein Baya_5111 [Bagarius yarrelli]
MAAMSGCSGDCALQRSLNKLLTTPSGSLRVKSQAEPLYVISLDRYGRDPNFGVYFPDSISVSDSVYDATVTDGDCRVRVSLDPRLNRLIHTNTLCCGSVVRNVVFSAIDQGENDSKTFHVCSLDVDTSSGRDAALVCLSSVNVDSLPWVMSGEPSLIPLRAHRSAYLPLWNNHDFFGETWRHTPPSENAGEDSEEDELVEDVQPVLSLAELRRRFLSGSLRRRGALCVRILHKSKLMYYGKADQSCECPNKAELQVADGSMSVLVVLWNSICLDWYRCLQPGQVLKLSRYRVKDSYGNRSGQDAEPNIEISLNSRNPAAKIAIVPKQQVSPEWGLPELPHNFISGNDLKILPHGTLCDVIGVVVFVGRQERIRSKDGRRSEFEEYRWLQLEDRTAARITIKLFSTSQPDIQSRIQPSTGSRSVMPYRGIRVVRQFLQWLKQVDEANMLDRALIGGYFSYPPLPISLQSFIEKRQGEAGMISGGEMKLQCDRLHYRERQRFIVQCTITTVCYHSRQDMRRAQYTDPLTAQVSPRVPRQREGSETFKTPTKRKLLFTTSPSGSTPRKRLAPPFQQTSSEVDTENDLSLFDSAIEFLVGDEAEDEEGDDENFFTPPSSPVRFRLGMPHVAPETIPRRFCYERRHVQAAAVGLQTNNFHKLLPQRELETFSPAQCYTGYFSLTLRADLIATAGQLTNRRLVCVLEACALGGDKVELILNRAFPLRS